MPFLVRAGMAVADALGIDIGKVGLGVLLGLIGLVMFIVLIPTMLLSQAGPASGGVPADLGLWVSLAEQEAGPVPPALILAVIDHESGGQWLAQHHNSDGTTDAGLMQVNSANWPAYGLAADPYVPAANIRAGVAILGGDLARHPSNVPAALEAYNAGTAANGWLFDPGYASTVLADAQAIETRAHLAATRIPGGEVIVTAFAATGSAATADGTTWPGIVAPATISATSGTSPVPLLSCSAAAGAVPAGADCWVIQSHNPITVTASWVKVVHTVGPHGHHHTTTQKLTAQASA